MHWAYVKGGVLDYNAGWELEMYGELTGNSSTFIVNQYLHSKSIDSQVSVSAEAPTLEDYKHSASVQSLLLLLRLVERK